MTTKDRIWVGYGIIYVLFILFAALAMFKIFETKKFKNDTWDSINGRIARTKTETVYPKRGTIYASGDKKVAESSVLYSVWFDGKQLDRINQKIIRKNKKLRKKYEDEDRTEERRIYFYFSANDSIKKLSKQMSKEFGMPAAYYQNIISKAFRETTNLLLKDSVNQFVLDSVLGKFTLLNSTGKYSSCLDYTHKKNSRMMPLPYGNLAVGTIGVVNYSGDTASYGIEKKFNTELGGKAGTQVKYIGVGNKTIPYIIDDPKNGKDITLTLDMDLQDIVTNSLLEGREVKNGNVEYACAILMEVETGKIKAMSSLKNMGGYYSERSAENKGLINRTELGSVFKVPSIMAALESGKLKSSDTIDCRTSKYPIGEAEGHNYGILTAAEVVMKSSNKGTANIIGSLFGDNISEYVDLLKKTCIDAPMDFEFKTTTPNFEKEIIKRDLPARSIGYLTIPPIYILRFYNAIANNGEMVNPYIVKKIGDKKFPEKKVVCKEICSDKTLTEIKKMLVGVVNNPKGTMYQSRSKNVQFAGKTGTANPVGTITHQATFCGYFPVDTVNLDKKPKYSCIVVMCKNGKLYGAENGKVFKNIAEKVYAFENEKKLSDVKKEKNTLPFVKKGRAKATEKALKEMGVKSGFDKGEWLVYQKDTTENRITGKPIELIENLVPNVEGMGARDAVYLLEKSGLRVRISGAGMVKEQSLPAGIRIVKGAIIEIKLN
ncbi:MAG: PASTA domain-containing protein [Prevotellaceae bacterium]|jgi:cell division protein FtsI (penicillin-binding protein 3)|nr:PASTA domain-containing protein [Prevotellaceae bacterium]